MNQEFRIAMAWHVSEKELAEYRTFVSPHCRILNPKSSSIEDLKAVAAQADAIIGPFIPQEMIESAPQVRMVQILHAGVATSHHGDSVLGFKTEYLAKRGILMGNIHGNSVAVAEQAMCFLLALAKQLVPANDAVRTTSWYPVTEETKSHMLCDSTLGIIGLGHIGGEVARMAKAFGMRVIGVDRSPEREEVRRLGLELAVPPAEMQRVLKEADFVLLTVPLTRETRGLIGEKELGQMKKDAYLINVARGPLVNEAALHKALSEKRIKGYAADVWWFYSYEASASSSTKNESEGWFDFGFHYTVPSRLEVNRLPNVIGTGDRATFTRSVTHIFIESGFRNVDMLARGERPANIVDIELGF